MSRTKQDILIDLFKTTSSDLLTPERYKSELISVCTDEIAQKIENLTKSINTASDSGNKLSGRLYFLNIIITIATLMMAIAAILQIFFNFS